MVYGVNRSMYPPKGYYTVNRKLAVLEGSVIYDEIGNIFIASTVEAVVDCVFAENMLLFISSFRESDQFTADLVSIPGAKVICSKYGQPIAARLKRKNQVRWIVTGNSWGSVVDALFLKQMRFFFDYVGLGVIPLPSMMGNMMMRYAYTTNGLYGHTTPNLSCQRDLRAKSPGGIVQCPGIGNSYDESINLDKSSAYLAEWSDKQPDGTAIECSGDSIDLFVAAFVDCTIHVHSELPISPFAIRSGGGEKGTIYPVKKGSYNASIWKEQILDCEKAGCTVDVHGGWGWRTFTTDNLQFGQYSYSLRQEAYSEFIQEKVKRCTNAAMGRHGMSELHYFLVPEQSYIEGDRPLPNFNGEASLLFVREELDFKTPYMVHWQKYTVAMTNSEVYNFALPYANEGRLLAIDFDAVAVLENNERELYPWRYDLQNIIVPVGTWLWRMLYDLRLKGKRNWKYREEYTKPDIRIGRLAVPSIA